MALKSKRVEVDVVNDPLKLPPTPSDVSIIVVSGHTNSDTILQ